jgi:hypothetical protein
VKPTNRNRILVTFAVCLAILAVIVAVTPLQKLRAQVVTVVGQIWPVNQYQQTVATGLAGAVTNPASNFIVQVAGGPIYFNGSVQMIAQTTLTLQANNTYLLVWNGQTEQLYAKQAVTGPGSPSASSGTYVNVAGLPTSVLFAVPGVEIPLNTIVCGSTNCGNTANGSLTDNRPLAAFPAGLYVGGHLNQASAGTTAAGAGTMTSTAGICTASSATTCVVTFSTTFQATPVCTVTDQTTTANGALKALPTATNLTITTTSSSDTFSYICVGNPN